MGDSLDDLGRSALTEGLSSRLGEVAWDSADLPAIVNLYLLGIFQRAGGAIAMRLSPLLGMGLELEVVDGASAALQLSALKRLDDGELATIVRQAWTQANGQPPSEEGGYRHFLGEVTLEAFRRLPLKFLS